MQGKYAQYLACGKNLFLWKSYLLVKGGCVVGWWPATHLQQTPGQYFSDQISLCAVTNISLETGNHKGSRLIYISRKKVELV